MILASECSRPHAGGCPRLGSRAPDGTPTLATPVSSSRAHTRTSSVREPASVFVCQCLGLHGGVGRDKWSTEEVRDVRSDDVGGGVVSVERIVGLLVAVSLVGLLVVGVKFRDRF